MEQEDRDFQDFIDALVDSAESTEFRASAHTSAVTGFMPQKAEKPASEGGASPHE